MANRASPAVLVWLSVAVACTDPSCKLQTEVVRGGFEFGFVDTLPPEPGVIHNDSGIGLPIFNLSQQYSVHSPAGCGGTANEDGGPISLSLTGTNAQPVSFSFSLESTDGTWSYRGAVNRIARGQILDLGAIATSRLHSLQVEAGYSAVRLVP
jgi:hypothetical protein